MLYKSPNNNDNIDMGEDVGNSTQRHRELSAYTKELTDVSISFSPVDNINRLEY